jgi:hypothetical protein
MVVVGSTLISAVLIVGNLYLRLQLRVYTRRFRQDAGDERTVSRTASNTPSRRPNGQAGRESHWLPFVLRGRMLSAAGTMESSMSKAGLDNRHRNHDGEISHKHGNTLIGTLRKIYGQSFAAGYPATEKLSEVLLQLNETSLSQLRRDHETGHLEHKIANAPK